jgi:murein DD-endopeptidase MepM/ murein hydrolase activator NlpD
MKKKLIALLIVSMVVLVQPNFVFSQEAGGNSEEIEILNQKIAEKKDKVKQLEASIEEYKKKIAQKRLEAVSLSNQLAILDNRLVQVELDIQVITNKLDTINLEIETLDLNIADKEKTIIKQQAIIAELIRTIHQNEEKSYLEIFAAYTSFSDFYNRLQYLQTVEQDLGKSAKALKIAREELEAKKTQKEEHRVAYEKLNDELKNKKKDLEEQTSYKSTLLAQTHASELTYKSLLNTQKNQYQQIESEIAGIEQEVRKRLDEQKLDQTQEDIEGLLSWPTQSRYVTSYFHDPDYPYRRVFEHNGIDIRAAHGTALKAVASGYIARAKKCTLSSCYSFVMIVHSGGISTVYGHMSSIVVSEDQFITRGDIIGYSGGTPGTVGAGPFVTGPHLHFEVRKDGIPVNPLGYLVKDY